MVENMILLSLHFGLTHYILADLDQFDLMSFYLSEPNAQAPMKKI
jgi:hypothetical protein